MNLPPNTRITFCKSLSFTILKVRSANSPFNMSRHDLKSRYYFSSVETPLCFPSRPQDSSALLSLLPSLQSFKISSLLYWVGVFYCEFPLSSDGLRSEIGVDFAYGRTQVVLNIRLPDLVCTRTVSHLTLMKLKVPSQCLVVVR